MNTTMLWQAIKKSFSTMLYSGGGFSVGTFITISKGKATPLYLKCCVIGILALWILIISLHYWVLCRDSKQKGV